MMECILVLQKFIKGKFATCSSADCTADGGTDHMSTPRKEARWRPGGEAAGAATFEGAATSRPSSPTRPKPRRRLPSPPRASSSALLEPPVSLGAGEEYYFCGDEEGGGVGNDNPRSFPRSVKQQCWEKADKVKGRHADRWRRDAFGNVVFRKLVGCPGCNCYDYDHIVPYSKGGKSTLENCQVLRVSFNRSKGNKTEISKADLIERSVKKTPYCRVLSGQEMDLIELSAYGDIQRDPEAQDSRGCSIQ